MERTERLYYTDSGLLEFTATVLDVRPSDQGYKVVLDRTAFYPTGGGQPNDLGTLGGGDVVDVWEDEAGVVVHTVSGEEGISAGKSIEGRINAARRLDHLQQHSGQHLLSQAFVRTCGAETRSFHLGSETSSIDIELQSPSDSDMRAAEDIANSVVFQDRPMRVHLLGEDEAARLPLRKESAAGGLIRVIEVEDFDWSPCGGTHAARTGQIGMIAIRSFERARKMTRVEFVCGRRALADYLKANQTATAIAQMFSVDRESALQSVERAVQENKSLNKRVRELLQIALGEEAARLLSQSEAAPGAALGGFKIVKVVFQGREIEEVRVLAHKVIEREPAIALFGATDGSSARLVFARSGGLPQNMGALMAEACQILGGRGGGKADMAQGGGPNVDKINAAIETAVLNL